MTLTVRYNLDRDTFNSSIDLEVPSKGITAIFGDSGCGKTTLLRMIAGLEVSPNSHIQFREDTWQDSSSFLPPHKRPIGYVFQEGSLFPHLNVKQNLEYGWRRTPKLERKIAFNDAVDYLGLSDLLKHKPDQLSGGQRQRVAIARALLQSPQLLLMDEPLSSLDDKGKNQILPYLQNLQDTFALPIIYVSHSIEEIASIADHLVLIEQGKVRASGPLNQLLTDPTLPLSKLDKACSAILGICHKHDETYHLTYLDIGTGQIAIALELIDKGKPVRIRVLAKDVSISLEHQKSTSITNIFPATVTNISTACHPSQIIVTLQIGEHSVLSRITKYSMDTLGLSIGIPVFAQIKSVSLMR